jgi:hypothetical protein
MSILIWRGDRRSSIGAAGRTATADVETSSSTGGARIARDLLV